ncbi:hypothetical protein K488DRAFT_88247 [Vararia minispora EC-137]|uniref:Uncharacterized protein n=1 Tax=Vararia minispora EC-137 TaxID=1314806 RepID=A0ACB8QEB7_9AGAM|nr:hypothetical protein K488DRAFT_88247 [Vararia minispora EC-137]
MFSFMKITPLATIAFGAVVSSLPQPVASPDIKALVVRQGAVGQLNALTADTVTPDHVQPIVIDIQVIISAAAVDACNGKPSGSGNLFVLVSVVINLVIGAFGRVYGYLGVDKNALIVIFQLID